MTLKNTNAKITVKSNILSDGEVMESQTPAEGNLYFKNGKYYIIYKEPDVNQLDDCITTVKTDLNTVLVKRSGKINTNLEFELNTAKKCAYKFEFGTIVMETFAHVINVELSENGGHMYLEYDLDTGGQKSYNKLDIKVEMI